MFCLGVLQSSYVIIPHSHEKHGAVCVSIPLLDCVCVAGFECRPSLLRGRSVGRRDLTLYVFQLALHLAYGFLVGACGAHRSGNVGRHGHDACCCFAVHCCKTYVLSVCLYMWLYATQGPHSINSYVEDECVPPRAE